MSVITAATGVRIVVGIVVGIVVLIVLRLIVLGLRLRAPALSILVCSSIYSIASGRPNLSLKIR